MSQDLLEAATDGVAVLTLNRPDRLNAVSDPMFDALLEALPRLAEDPAAGVFFSIRLAEEISRYRRFSHPVSVILLDLDGLKVINYELGHAAGDDTLRELSRILLTRSRKINVFCRYGGDEFAVLLVETPKAGAVRYAERIRQAVADYPFTHGRRMTASFGVAGFPDDVASTAEDLLQAVDEALCPGRQARQA